jgi:hypothetical protein
VYDPKPPAPQKVAQDDARLTMARQRHAHCVTAFCRVSWPLTTMLPSSLDRIQCGPFASQASTPG